MRASTSRPLAETLLLSSILAFAALGGVPAGIKAPFEVHPGAIYLGLLAWPAFLGGGEGAEGGPDIQLGAYGGPAYTMPSPLTFTEPGGTALRFRAISWDGEPFDDPPYYGLRGIVWPANGRHGVMADFTHIKAKAVKHAQVEQEGTRDGAPVPPQEKLAATFRRLEFTHGYNLLTFNVVRRGSANASRLLAYAGAGAGIAIPHVEVGRRDSPPKTQTSEYQITGPAVQVLGGVEWRFAPQISLFVEYKLSCATIQGDVRGGGSVDTNLCTHQLLGGPAWHLKAPRAAAP
jgi:lipid A oxidase